MWPFLFSCFRLPERNFHWLVQAFACYARSMTEFCRFPPPEWAPHASVWTAWPTNDEEWDGLHQKAAQEVADMVRALAAPGPEGRPGDKVKVLVQGDAIAAANAAIGDIAEIVETSYGDIWLRDTGPIYLEKARAAGFRWNGWGHKYLIPHDDKVAAYIAGRTQSAFKTYDFVLEGGAVDGDGRGNWLTTRQCLLNDNRNPNWQSEADAEAALAVALGARKLIWLDDGLLNDHTDGHVDNIARFVAPGIVLCQSPWGDDDPNRQVLDKIFDDLSAASTADGEPLKVLRIPSPGRVVDDRGHAAPASHMNFFIGNGAVVLPIYGPPSDANVQEAISILSDIYPNRHIVPLPARTILTGGGSFHCITQQQPAS